MVKIAAAALGQKVKGIKDQKRCHHIKGEHIKDIEIAAVYGQNAVIFRNRFGHLNVVK